MKKCMHCGEVMEDDEEFCPVCGYEVEKKEELQTSKNFENTHVRHKHCALTGFILGLLAFLLGGNIILGIMAIIFSHMQIKQEKAMQAKKRDCFATAGFVLGICIVILYVLALILYWVNDFVLLTYLNMIR